MEENTVNTNTAESAEKATFDQVLQDPDYRRAFDERVRTAVSRRFRTLDAQRAQIRELAGDMARHLGLPPGEDGQVDLNALRAALAENPSSDSPPPEEKALEGAAHRMEEEGAEKLSAQPTDEGDEAPIRASFRRVMAEGEHLRQLYPGFDLGAELANPRFAALLASLERTGAPEPVRTAYEATHHDQIMGGVVRYAVERTAAQLAEGIRAGALRPAENGGAAASDTRLDPRTLSPQQRRDIRQRVMRGERVTF